MIFILRIFVLVVFFFFYATFKGYTPFTIIINCNFEYGYFSVLHSTFFFRVKKLASNQYSENEDHDPITSWEIDGETVEKVSDFIFLGSKITADGDCGHEIKRRLLLGRKVMTNLDRIFKG